MTQRTRQFLYSFGFIFFIIFTPSLLMAEEITTSFAASNYTKLRNMLPLYENAMAHPWPVLYTKKLLKPGMKNAVIPLLRERLLATQDLPQSDYRQDNLFDAHLAFAVKNFQERMGLHSDGIVGPRTLQELNISPAVRVKQIETNMQHWTDFLSSKLGDRFIWVNIPDYHLYVYDHYQKILSMKVIVGKPSSPTPEIQSRIVRVEFNPPWNVPSKIAQKEIVKKIIADPHYLVENHIQIYTNHENNAETIDPHDIDWKAVKNKGFPYYFRQDPGEDNSLGLIKFEFNNSANVYLHDTPAKALFNQDNRALSHGCIRLENIFSLVNYLMKDDPEWSEDRMQDILSYGKTKYLKAYDPIPIFITYFTAWVDENGKINFRDDIYNKG